MWFTTKVRYEKTRENGSLKTITEPYLVDALSFTEAEARIDGREWIDADCYEIAKNDGLNTTDFKEWFFGRHPKGDKVFHGVIIHFTDFRY